MHIPNHRKSPVSRVQLLILYHLFSLWHLFSLTLL